MISYTYLVLDERVDIDLNILWQWLNIFEWPENVTDRSILFHSVGKLTMKIQFGNLQYAKKQIDEITFVGTK